MRNRGAGLFEQSHFRRSSARQTRENFTTGFVPFRQLLRRHGVGLFSGIEALNQGRRADITAAFVKSPRY